MRVSIVFVFKKFNLRASSFFVKVSNIKTVTLYSIEKSKTEDYKNGAVMSIEAAKILVSYAPIEIINE